MFARKEGLLTRMLEKQTRNIPSGAFLALAGGSVAASLAAHMAGKKQLANFIGLWTPTILMLGMYNKIVKQLT